MTSRTNNYLRDRRGNFHFFDDRDPAQVEEANAATKDLRHGKEGAVAWRATTGLRADGYVGVPQRVLSDLD